MAFNSQMRKQAILESIERLTSALGRFPTTQEVADDTRTSVSSVLRLSRQLEADGLVRRHYGSRALERLPEPQPGGDPPA